MRFSSLMPCFPAFIASLVPGCTRGNLVREELENSLRENTVQRRLLPGDGNSKLRSAIVDPFRRPVISLEHRARLALKGRLENR